MLNKVSSVSFCCILRRTDTETDQLAQTLWNTHLIFWRWLFTGIIDKHMFSVSRDLVVTWQLGMHYHVATFGKLRVYRCLYTTLWNLTCSSRRCYHCIVRDINSGIYPISTMASKFARIKSSWLQRVGILQEKMYKTRITDLDELKQRLRTERAMQAGSSRHCSSHSSVASSIAADQWCMFCILLLQYFPHAVIN